MEKHINYQLIEKISRNRRKNRDEIKRLIRDKEFYFLQLSIPVIDNLIGNVNYKIVNNYKFSIKNGDFKANPLILLKYKDINSRRITVSDIKGENLHSYLELLTIVGDLSYDKDSPTIIYIEKEGIKLPIVYISVEEKNRKYKINYSEFNSIKNYPDFDTYKNQRDLELSKIISPYYFTGYSFKVEYIIYDKELKNELNRKIINRISPVFNLDKSARIILPDKYCSWKFNKD